MLFNRTLNRISLVPIPHDTGDFRLLDRRVVDALKKMPERNRFMKGLFSWVGLQTNFNLFRPSSTLSGRKHLELLETLELCS